MFKYYAKLLVGFFFSVHGVSDSYTELINRIPLHYGLETLFLLTVF